MTRADRERGPNGAERASLRVMSTPQQYRRDRGSLFHNADKRKPSQPDMRGDCTIGGAAYDVQAWRREDQLAITLAPVRGDSNTYPPDAFRGALDPARHASEDGAVWTGHIVGEELRYAVRAFAKEGKSGPYLTLQFEAEAG